MMTPIGGPLPGGFGTTGPGPKLLGTDRRSVMLSSVSSVVFLGLLALLLFAAPGSSTFRHVFLSPSHMLHALVGNNKDGLPGVGPAILTNIKMFLIAEVFILAFALVIALVRQSRGPVMFPIRVLATAYVDIFRGVPLLLVIYVIGFGAPALYLKGISTQTPTVYAVVALVLSYSAYVSEVYRAGLNSVNQSQVAAARSLGMSSWTSMRYVVLPQAVRNILPALLNDFIALQKDTALAGVIGVIEANQAAEIYGSSTFNYSSLTVSAVLFLILTIPLARFTDGLIARDRQRRLAAAY